jgi:hypothetical protein
MQSIAKILEDLNLSQLAPIRLLTAMSISVQWSTNIRGDAGTKVVPPPQYTTNSYK